MSRRPSHTADRASRDARAAIDVGIVDAICLLTGNALHQYQADDADVQKAREIAAAMAVDAACTMLRMCGHDEDAVTEQVGDAIWRHFKEKDKPDV